MPYHNKMQKNIHHFVNRIYFKTEISQYISLISTSILLGVVAGLGALLFHYLLEQMKHFFTPQTFTRFLNIDTHFLVIIPFIGAVVIATMSRLFPLQAKEKGVLSVIKSILLDNGYIPFKITLFHLFAPIISIGTGAPLGPEGPAAKIGSGFGSFMSQVFRFKRKDMMMYTAAGAGAAISAVFNAPIAGVFFGIEVILLNDLKDRALTILIISSVVADILSRAVLGNNQIFTIPHYTIGTVGNYPFFLVLGILAGIVSILFSLLKKGCRTLFNDVLKVQNQYLRLLPVALIFGLVLLKYYQLFGIGYSTINDVFYGNIQLYDAIILFMLKILFLALFLEAGSFGGTFAPSLMIGAFLGFIFASSINMTFNLSLDPVAFSLVGMGGALAGMNSIPLTAIMLVFEITNDYKFILPLMLVSIISYIVTVYYRKGNSYTIALLREGIDISELRQVDLLGNIKVNSLMRKDFIKISYKLPFKEVYKKIMHSKYGNIFVVDDKGKYKGTISLLNIRKAITNNDLIDLLIAQDLAADIKPVKENASVSLAIRHIEENDVEYIPVISSEKPHKLIGILPHQDILQAYNTLLKERTTDQFVSEYGRAE